MASQRDTSRSKGPSEHQGPLTRVMHRNIQALVTERRRRDQGKPWPQRIADAITHFTGSMKFVVLHVVLFGGWIVVNLGWVPGMKPFDPFPFVMLAMFASVEAIFLSTFVLISQNRMAEVADKRADLDLQVNLLAEHEITRLIRMMDAIARRLDVDEGRDGHLEELKQDVKPEQVLDEMERINNDKPHGHSPP